MRVGRLLAGVSALQLSYMAGVLNTEAHVLIIMGMMGLAGLVAGYLAA